MHRMDEAESGRGRGIMAFMDVCDFGPAKQRSVSVSKKERDPNGSIVPILMLCKWKQTLGI